ncbi:hypothetical protein U1Q18_030460 [Sarracenia purpurea var. burkii]
MVVELMMKKEEEEIEDMIMAALKHLRLSFGAPDLRAIDFGFWGHQFSERLIPESGATSFVGFQKLRGENDCLLLFRDVVRRGFPRPNHFSCPPLLGSGPEFLEFCGTELAHTQVMRSGFERYPVAWTALFDLYSGFCFDFEIARRLFDERDVSSWGCPMKCPRGTFRPGALLLQAWFGRHAPYWYVLVDLIGVNPEDLAGAVDDGVASVPYRRLNAGQYVAYFLWFLRLMWPFAMMLWWLLPCAGRCRSGRGPIECFCCTKPC